jgi:hypothetical protein
MAVLLLHETTILGDAHSKQVDKKGFVTRTATRTFTIEIDNASDRSIEEIYEMLPKAGDSHPNIPGCLVRAIDVKVTQDPHIYEATVEYGTPEIEELEDDDKDAPWNQPGTITISADSSQVEPAEFAYMRWPYTEGTKIPAFGAPSEGSFDAEFPLVPVVNEPMGEKFKTVPEEPTGGMSLTVSFAEKARTLGGILNTQILYDIKNEVFTVNTVIIMFAGYVIAPYHGYFSDASSELAFYRKTPKHKPIPYFNVRLTITENPKTWVRLVQNMSMNQMAVDTEGNTYLSPIQVLSKESGLTEDVKEPVLIHPTDGKAIAYDQFGKATNDKRIYVLPFLTKKPSQWKALEAILNRVLAR